MFEKLSQKLKRHTLKSLLLKLNHMIILKTIIVKGSGIIITGQSKVPLEAHDHDSESLE